MQESDFWDDFKSKVDEVKQDTLATLLTRDKQYNDATERYGKAEAKYEKIISELKKKHQKIIRDLLFWTDCSNMEYNTLSYIAGIKDGARFWEHFIPEEIKAMEDEGQVSLVKELYEISEFAEKYIRESEDTVKAWKWVNQLEGVFSEKLDKGQRKEFEKLIQLMTEAASMAAKDEFVCGYQVGVKTQYSL